MSTTCTEANLDEVLGPSLTEEQAGEIYRQGEEVVVMAMMKMAATIAAMCRPVADAHHALRHDSAIS